MGSPVLSISAWTASAKRSTGFSSNMLMLNFSGLAAGPALPYAVERLTCCLSSSMPTWSTALFDVIASTAAYVPVPWAEGAAGGADSAMLFKFLLEAAEGLPLAVVALFVGERRFDGRLSAVRDAGAGVSDASRPERRAPVVVDVGDADILL